MPIATIPCLHYRRELERERENQVMEVLPHHIEASSCNDSMDSVLSSGNKLLSLISVLALLRIRILIKKATFKDRRPKVIRTFQMLKLKPFKKIPKKSQLVIQLWVI